DGIRDFHVTGVQTCALPICIVETRLARAMLGGEVTQGDAIRVGWDATAEQLRIEPVGKAASKTQNVSGAKETKARRRNPARPERSEERRVGKESRTRWARGQ